MPTSSPSLFDDVPRNESPPRPFHRKSVHGGETGSGDVQQKVETARSIMLARLDDLGATDLWPVAAEEGLSHESFLRMYQKMLLALFPDECGDGESYAPSPDKRLDGVRHRLGGLFPYPCEGMGDDRSVAYAECVIVGESSPVAAMRGSDGRAMFSRSELARLGARKLRTLSGGTR